MNKNILLIGFYNEKALGVRYLYRALKENGFTPHTVYFKAFNSLVPQSATDKELELLRKLIEEIDPVCVGMSVMSSLYLETIHKVSRVLNVSFPDIPIIWGGVYATLEPRRALEECGIVLRGEGEDAFVETVRAISEGRDWREIQNAAYLDADGEMVENPLRPLSDIDRFGWPPIGGDNIFLIHDDAQTKGDPQLKSYTYELCASRGCPFSCTYCSSVNIRRLYRGLGTYVRFRSVDSVMDELNEAKAKLPKLRVVHFWDEIFSDEPGWVDEFARRYKAEIGLPFRIWGHPLKASEHTISHLVDAGLHQIVMGIQSGSEQLRRETFNRRETQAQILEASRVLAKCRVPVVYYDFMLCHPFESEEQLRETFDLCVELNPPFKLNIHGLNFLPSTDILGIAVERGVYTPEELDKMMYSSIQEQYDQYWGPNAKSFEGDSNVWISLIYLTQFPKIRARILALATDVRKNETEIHALRRKMEKSLKFTDFVDKVKLVLRIG